MATKKDTMEQLVKKELSKYNMDGWANVMIGLAKREDKRTHTQYGDVAIIPDEELELIYAGDGLGTKIVDIVADDMTREWIDLDATIEDKEELTAAKAAVSFELERLDAQSVFNEALKWARLYGGSVVVIGAEDGGKLEEPLNMDRIRNITYLRVVDRSDVYIDQSKFDSDISSPTFGALQALRVRFDIGTITREVDVHPSRCLFFYGKPAPSMSQVDVNIDYWGFSELQPIYGILSDLGTGYESIVNALYEFSVAVYKLTGLADMLAAGEEAKVIARMDIINTMKSVLHGVMLDQNEDYRRENITFGGISDIIDRLTMRLSGSTTIPLTRLFGRSPAGLNATGEGDEKIYFDVVRAAQTVKLTKPLRHLITMIQAWKKQKVVWQIIYKPLYQPTEKEAAETDKINADTAKIKADTYAIYVSMGALSGEEVYQLELSEQFDPIRAELLVQFEEEVAEGGEGELEEFEEEVAETADGIKSSIAEKLIAVFKKDK